MSNLMQAHHQWASRPADERFTSLIDMREHFIKIRRESSAKVVSSRVIDMVPAEDNKGLYIQGKEGIPFVPTHWAFGQLAQLAGAPSGYLRQLPSPIAADCINYGLKHARDVEDVGLLLQSNGERTLRAATGPRYGRIWNEQILAGMIRQLGDGVSGDWRVPGEFGKQITVNKENTTLYASDQDMFVFLADETNRIEIPNRRDGKTGSLARGFFVWNSEVGATSFGLSTFLFDYACSNRTIWGAADYKEFRLRHTASAPDRFIEQIQPALLAYSRSSTATIEEGIKSARRHRINDVEDFLARRFTKRLSSMLLAQHLEEEGRPIENLWDASNAVTAHARSIANQNDRVAMERKAGDILDLAR